MSGENAEEQGQEQQEPTLRDEIEAAVAAAEAEVDEPSGEESTAEAEPAPSEAGSEEGAGAEDAAEAKDTGEPAGDQSGRAAAEPSTQPVDERPDDATRYPNLSEKVAKAPAQWRPNAREGWEKLPENVRREVHRREMDIAAALQDTAEARKHHDRFTRAVTPFQALIAAEGGSDPIDAVSHLLQTAATLSQGAPHVKAQRIAQLVRHYGVDIQALDQALTADMSDAPAGTPGNGAGDGAWVDKTIAAAIDSRLAPVQDFMKQMNETLTAAGNEQAAATRADIEEFSESAEFMSDVRLDMADLLETAANRGRKMSLQEAYDIACQMNPDVKQVLAQRAAQTASAAVEKKEQLARTSVTGAQAGQPPAESNGDLRSDIQRAFDQVTNRTGYN